MGGDDENEPCPLSPVIPRIVENMVPFPSLICGMRSQKDHNAPFLHSSQTFVRRAARDREGVFVVLDSDPFTFLLLVHACACMDRCANFACSPDCC